MEKTYPIMDLNENELELLLMAIECIDLKRLPNPALITFFGSLRKKIKKAAKIGGVSFETHWEE